MKCKYCGTELTTGGCPNYSCSAYTSILYVGDENLKFTEYLNNPEPEPQKSDSPAIWDLVIEDMKDRDNTCSKKYGTRLQANNGRDPLVDAYQEALDLAVYLRQELYERYGK
jgi:hypothetical protein